MAELGSAEDDAVRALLDAYGAIDAAAISHRQRVQDLDGTEEQEVAAARALADSDEATDDRTQHRIAQLRKSLKDVTRLKEELHVVSATSDVATPEFVDVASVRDYIDSKLERVSNLIKEIQKVPYEVRVRKWLIFSTWVPQPRTALFSEAAACLDSAAAARPVEVHLLKAEANARYQTAYKKATKQRAAEVKASEAEFQKLLQAQRQRITNVAAHFPPIALASLRDEVWRAWQPPDTPTRLLRVGSTTCEMVKEPLPVAVAFPRHSGIAIESNDAKRPDVIGLINTLLLRTLLSLPAGGCRFTFIDPVGLGQSVAPLLHLAEYDELLIDSKVWTQQREISDKLDEVSAHVERIIQKYLRSQFTTIDEFNESAGEVVEPYRLLAVLDFPHGFSDDSVDRLLSIIENGPRCGVHVALMFDPSATPSRNVSYDRLLRSMQLLQWKDESLVLQLANPSTSRPFQPDAQPELSFTDTGRAASQFAELLSRCGEAVRGRDRVQVDFNRSLAVLARMTDAGVVQGLPYTHTSTRLAVEEPDTWWQASSQDRVAVPIGRRGAQDLTLLSLDSAEAFGGIVIGAPGMGKSTLFHTIIIGLALMYPPEELEFYLLDSRQGVEFKLYEQLPHARAVAIRNEREFGVAVLQSLVNERDRRAELMKANTPGKAAQLALYRELTGEKLARIVLVADEFHELFEVDDSLGQQAGALMDDLIRQGRGYGIHVLLGSQSIGNIPTLPRATLDQLPLRIAFASSSYDADAVMGPDNRDVRFLSRSGQGIFNPVRGQNGKNQPFQGILITEAERRKVVDLIIDESNKRLQHEETPVVFDGDAAVSRFVMPSARTSRRSGFGFAVGLPLSLEPPVRIELRRQAQHNFLFVGRQSEDRDTYATSVIHSALLDLSQDAQGVVVDFLGEDADGSLSIAELAKEVGVKFTRSASINKLLADLQTQVEDRIATEDYEAPALFVVLNGIQRWRALDSSDYEDDSHLARLTRLAVNGPEVGVHLLATVDSRATLARRMNRELLDEFGVRLCSQVSADDGRDLMDDPSTERLRVNQALLYDRERGRHSRLRLFAPVAEHEIAELRQPERKKR